MGLSAIDYVRAAGIPQMMYGCEVMGMADTMVTDAVRVTAKALAPPTPGKNPTLVMHAAGIHSHSVDPRVPAFG